jgi:hypothetical protein
MPIAYRVKGEKIPFDEMLFLNGELRIIVLLFNWVFEVLIEMAIAERGRPAKTVITAAIPELNIMA